MHADDAALVSEKEADLQMLLDVLQEWCVRWRMFVNVDKTAIMHFRLKQRQCTNVRFEYEGNMIKIVDKISILGYDLQSMWSGVQQMKLLLRLLVKQCVH